MMPMSSLPRCLAASLLMVCALHRQAISAPQTPTLQVRISDREIADRGDPFADVDEPDVCVSREHRIAAAQAPKSIPFPAPAFLDGRFAVGTNQASGWASGELTGFRALDVSIALADNTPDANKFVVVGMNSPSIGDIRYCIYSPGSTPQFGPWIVAASAGGSGNAIDKPWVIRRTAGDFFLFYYRGAGSGYRYLRTPDGTNWREPGGDALTAYEVRDGAGMEILGSFCCQPAVGADGKIWLAYATGVYGSGGTIRILVGSDPDPEWPDSGTGPLIFAPLLSSNGLPAEIAPRHSQNTPWPATSPLNRINAHTVPYLACSTEDPSIAYVFYTDTAQDDIDDLDAHVGRFVRTSDPLAPTGYSWSTDDRILHDEHTSSVGVRSDQFQPIGVVDSAGRIHVAYYSNRPSEFVGSDEGGVPGDQGGYTSKYDYWYSLSIDRGLSFSHYNLRTDPDMKRPLNLDLQTELDGTGEFFSPREYNGIDYYETGGYVRIHFVYTGAVKDTLIPDDIDQRSLLFGQQLQVKPVQIP